MKHRVLTALLVATLLSGCAFANTIIYMIPNDGSGDNFGFVTYGPGYYFSGDGGLSYSLFNWTDGYAPGSVWPVGGELFLGSGLAKVGGTSFEIFYQAGASLFVSSFTFPAKGTSFRPLVDVGFSAVGFNPDTGETFDVNGGAQGYINFYFYNGLWYTGSRFEEVPEPGTLALIVTGVLGLSVPVRMNWRTLDRRKKFHCL
jgi:hypothetical protein